jgi:hypothetical protein
MTEEKLFKFGAYTTKDVRTEAGYLAKKENFNNLGDWITKCVEIDKAIHAVPGLLEKLKKEMEKGKSLSEIYTDALWEYLKDK